MIKLLKTGQWALGGTQVVDTIEDEEASYGAQNDFELVQAGWAEWVQVEKADSAPKATRKKVE